MKSKSPGAEIKRKLNQSSTHLSGCPGDRTEGEERKAVPLPRSNRVGVSVPMYDQDTRP